jgi:hypothetical protein
MKGQIGRFKQVTGKSLRFHTDEDEAQATEIAITV